MTSTTFSPRSRACWSFCGHGTCQDGNAATLGFLPQRHTLSGGRLFSHQSGGKNYCRFYLIIWRVGKKNPWFMMNDVYRKTESPWIFFDRLPHSALFILTPKSDRNKTQHKTARQGSRRNSRSKSRWTKKPCRWPSVTTKSDNNGRLLNGPPGKPTSCRCRRPIRPMLSRHNKLTSSRHFGHFWDVFFFFWAIFFGKFLMFLFGS